MKTIQLLLISILYTSILLSQASLQWESTYMGPVSNDIGNKIAIDAMGNTIATGYSEGLSSGRDYFTIKYNSQGDTLWTRRYNGPGKGFDEATAISLDASGAVYITGKSQGIGNGLNIVTIKYSNTGTQLWQVSYNGNSNIDDAGNDLIVDNSGNVYVAGTNNIQSEYSGAILLKYDSNGNKIDESYYDLGDKNEANLVKINNLGNIVVSVYLHIVPRFGSYDPCEGGYSIFELNPSNLNTLFTYGPGPSSMCLTYIAGYPQNIHFDQLDNIYVASSDYKNSLKSQITKFTHADLRQTYTWYQYRYYKSGEGTIKVVDSKMDANKNLYLLSNLNESDYSITKIDKDGQEVWFNIYYKGNNSSDIPVSIQLNNNSNPDLYLCGNLENKDILITKIDHNGNFVWDTKYDCGNSGNDAANAMIIDKNENLYLTGSSNCNNSALDIKTIKYCSNAPDATIIADGPTQFCKGKSVNLSVNRCQGCSYLWNTGQTLATIQVSPLINTTYWVTVTNAADCHSITSIPIVIDNLPNTPGVISGPIKVCKNARYTYSISPISTATSYTWNLPSEWKGSSLTNTISVISSENSGMITVVANNDCGSSPTRFLNVSTVQIDTTVTIQNNELISNEPGGSYQWIDCDTRQKINGATQYNYSPGRNGNFQVEISKDGCVSRSACYPLLFVKNEDKLNSAIQLSVYPNPCTDNISISGKFRSENGIHCSLFNQLGSEIFQQKLSLQTGEEVIKLDLTKLEPGIYSLRVQSGNTQSNLKIVKL